MSTGLPRNLKNSLKVLYIGLLQFKALKCLENKGFVSRGLKKVLIGYLPSMIQSKINLPGISHGFHNVEEVDLFRSVSAKAAVRDSNEIDNEMFNTQYLMITIAIWF